MKYQVGGSLQSNDPTYIVRQADEQLYAGLKAGDFCYVFSSRQMGKSSLLQRTSYRLEQEGYVCVHLDASLLSSNETTPLQWYKGIILSLFHSLDLAQQVNFNDWWEQQKELSPVQRLYQFVEEVLRVRVKHERIFILIDKIHSLLSLKFPIDDFFVWIHHCYNQRAYNCQYKQLDIALFGVASPSDLIADKHRSPFNMGRAIQLHGFGLHEATPLLQGLEETITQPETILQEIIRWTAGQPFLTQKLCQLVMHLALESSTGTITIPHGAEGFWVERLVLKRIIQNWEFQDDPQHLRTIRDRLLYNQQQAAKLLLLYQQILQTQKTCKNLVPSSDSRDVTELLLSGLVERYYGYLKVKNAIYLNVFNSKWVTSQLNNLPPDFQADNGSVPLGWQYFFKKCYLKWNNGLGIGCF